MLIYFQTDPDDTPTSVKLKEYPSLVSETGSPFSGAAITDLGDGQWSVNIGVVTGNWKLWALTVDDELAASGFASSDYVDGSGNATLTDYAPWLSIPILDPAAGGGFEAGTLEINQGASYDDVAHARKIWASAKDYRTWTGVFRIRHRVTNETLLSKVATATAANQVEVELTAVDTAFAALASSSEFGPHPYDIHFTLGSNVQRAMFGRAIVYRTVPGELAAPQPLIDFTILATLFPLGTAGQVPIVNALATGFEYVDQWGGGGDGGTTIIVQEGDVTASAAVGTVDYGPGFDVAISPAGEANITLDFSEIADDAIPNAKVAGLGSAALVATTAFDAAGSAAAAQAASQPLDAELAAIAGLTSAADRLPYFTGSGTASLATFTSAGRSIVAGADAAAIRTVLGIDTDDSVTFGNITVNALIVNGTVTTVNSATLTVDDPLIRLADSNSADSVDTGFYALYVSAGSKYAGLFRDASDGKFRLFVGLQTEPTTTVDTGGAGYTVGTLVASLEGNAATATTATNITTANEASDTTCFLVFVTAAAGDLGAKTNSAFTINSSTGAFGATSIELGHAADTTLTRVSAGVIAVEGDNLQRATDVANTKIAAIGITIDGGGSTITTGIKGRIEVPFACTINRATLIADQTGSIVVDIWKDTYANYPPTVADRITASAKPTLSSAIKSQDSTLTGWTTTVAAGDVLFFNVDSATTVTQVTLVLKVTKT